MDDAAVAILKETFTSANSYAELATLAVVVGLIIDFAVLLSSVIFVPRVTDIPA